MSNTVLSLSALQKYDDKPFIVCIVTPDTNYMMLANSTFLKKISHSSQELRVDNIRGSFNGSDIMIELGVAQFNGKALVTILEQDNGSSINHDEAQVFLKRLIDR